MLLFAANVCFARFITVYYDHIGLSRKLMGFLLVVTPMMSFVGGMFWSIVVDITGKYKLILTSSGLLAVALVFSYLLPAVGKSWPLLLGITFVQGFLTSPAGPVVDGLCLKVLKEQTGPQEKKDRASGGDPGLPALSATNRELGCRTSASLTSLKPCLQNKSYVLVRKHLGSGACLTQTQNQRPAPHKEMT